MKHLTKLIYIFLFVSKSLFAQNEFKGFIYDQNNKPIPFATLALLDPSDSSLIYFSISDETGKFSIKNLERKNYLLQASFLGYQTYYKQLNIDPNNSSLEIVQLKPKSTQLSQVDVEADRIPIRLNKDTLEYDAAAYKTKPDAVAEDLLKKMPGIEVDRSGNIKAMGENVSNVLVDGKEFFSNDPKVATKNLPADAVKKVQVYDRKSDEEELSGMSDGERDKTINILLKDDKKKAVFGDVQAGYGTNNRYALSSKLYKFNSKTQLASLGMLNNINQFGFSFQDYLSFSGGIGSLNNGGISLGGNAPIDFGQPIYGMLQSGAVALNFTQEYAKAKRFNISYIGSGLDKNLKEEVYSRNFTEQSEFVKNANNSSLSRDYSHKISSTWRNKIDSTQNLNVYSTLGFSNSNSNVQGLSSNLSNNIPVNTLLSSNEIENFEYSGNLRANYSKRINDVWRILKLGYETEVQNADNYRTWNNTTSFSGSGLNFIENRSQLQQTLQFKNNLSWSNSFHIYKSLFLDASISGSKQQDVLNRTQKNLLNSDSEIDSLSPKFNKEYTFLKSGIALNYNTNNTQITLGLRTEFMNLNSELKDLQRVEFSSNYLLPSFEFQREYSKGKRIQLNYTTRINTPSNTQLLPVINNSNPLLLSSGNQQLKPEYIHQYSTSWFIFDQFSFVSFVNTLNFTHTKDKISWNRTIDSNLVQYLKNVNVDDDYRLRLSTEFSSPIRKLKMNIHLELAENINQSYTIINNQNNINTNFGHELTLRMDNRKKDKWDINIGATVSWNTSSYSLQKELNNRYTNEIYFTELSYRPSDKWFVQLTADISNYSSESFNESINIPLLRLELNRYFLQNNRGVFTMQVFDLLNKNTGVQRIADQNILQETRSNIIGRYVLFSFKYRLNKFAEKNSGVKVDIK